MGSRGLGAFARDKRAHVRFTSPLGTQNHREMGFGTNIDTLGGESGAKLTQWNFETKQATSLTRRID